MTEKEYREKAINAVTRVEKCHSILKKHRASLEKMLISGDEFKISCKREDIKGAEQKLNDALNTLQRWREKLDASISRREFIEANTPAILKEFLEKWKISTISYYVESYDSFLALKKDLSDRELAARRQALITLPAYEENRKRYAATNRDIFSLSSYDLNNIWPRTPMENYLSTLGLEYHQIKKKLQVSCNPIISRMCCFRDPAERKAWLEKTIEEEKECKLLDLMTRINKVVGTITNADHLYMEAGDINGKVYGTEGAATVQTIGAGGWNIQCFHFRTLVHEINQEQQNKTLPEATPLQSDKVASVKDLIQRTKMTQKSTDQKRNRKKEI